MKFKHLKRFFCALVGHKWRWGYMPFDYCLRCDFIVPIPGTVDDAIMLLKKL